jgi:hypothetical protein
MLFYHTAHLSLPARGMERGGNQVFIAFCGHTHSVLEWEASGALFTSDWALHYTSLLLLLLLLLLFVCPG